LTRWDRDSDLVLGGGARKALGAAVRGPLGLGKSRSVEDLLRVQLVLQEGFGQLAAAVDFQLGEEV